MPVQVNSAIAQFTNVIDAQDLPTLQIGDRGSSVEALQQKLSLYVEPLPFNSEFDIRTEHAVRSFQYSMFLSEDGIVGPQTWNALFSGKPPATLPTLRPGENGPAVVWVQEVLMRLGVYRAARRNPVVDGWYGPATEAAVRQYQSKQQRRGFGVDGVVGPQTWFALSRDRLQALSHPIYDIRLLKRDKAHSGQVSAIAISSTGTFYTGSADTLVQDWSVTGDRLGGRDFGDGGSVSDVALNPTTLEVVSSTFGGTIRTSDFALTTNSRENRFPGRGASVLAVDVSEDGRFIIAGNSDASLRLFDLKGKLLGEMNDHRGQVTDVAFNPRVGRSGEIISVDTTQKVVSSTIVSSDGGLDTALRSFSLLSDSRSSVGKSSLAVSSGYYIAVAGGPWLRIFSALGELLFAFDYQIALNDVAFSPCGRYLALACGDRVIRVLDLFPSKEGEADISLPVYELSGHSQSVSSVAFAQDSTYLYSGAADGEVIIWQVQR